MAGWKTSQLFIEPGGRQAFIINPPSFVRLDTITGPVTGYIEEGEVTLYDCIVAEVDSYHGGIEIVRIVRRKEDNELPRYRIVVEAKGQNHVAFFLRGGTIGP